VAKSLNLNEATERTIKQSEDKINQSVSAGVSVSAKKICRTRDKIKKTMEKTLMIWIDDNNVEAGWLDDNPALTLTMVWKSFTIWDCVNIVAAAKEDEYQRIINLAHFVGFEDMAVEELRERTVESELNEADLIDLLTDANSNADPDEDDIENEAPSATTSFNSKAIGEHLTMATKAAHFFLENDPSPELGQKFHREFTQIITWWYKEIHNNLTKNKKQPLITQFVTKY
jgi:hypothetical protein